MTSMLECEQYVNVVRLIVPSAEITAEMHRRAQEAAQAGQKPITDDQENEPEERCPHDPACKIKCREKTYNERKKSSSYFKGNNLHEPHKREKVHEGNSSEKPYQRLHSKEKITYDTQGHRLHIRERPSKHQNQHLHQSEVRDYPQSHMQVRIDAPDTARKISEPCSRVLQQRLSLLHISRSKTSREGSASPEWPIEVGKKSSWCRSPSPTSGNTGYDQYQKSLLEVPWCIDYGDASSDDLSSEWDSDVPEPPPPLHPKVINISNTV